MGTPPRPVSSAKTLCKQLTPADIMLGAATRAASGLVRQTIAGNVSKALPAVANQRQFSVTPAVEGHKGQVVSVIGAASAKCDTSREKGNFSRETSRP